MVSAAVAVVDDVVVGVVAAGCRGVVVVVAHVVRRRADQLPCAAFVTRSVVDAWSWVVACWLVETLVRQLAGTQLGRWRLGNVEVVVGAVFVRTSPSIVFVGACLEPYRVRLVGAANTFVLVVSTFGVLQVF